MINCEEIIGRYYVGGSALHEVLTRHSRSVAELACRLGERALSGGMRLDLDFVYEASLLHDIGIFKTDAPGIYCEGTEPYVCHGVLGRELLDGLGLYRHALVCERHTGSGLPLDEIIAQNLPLPHRDLVPVTLEEKLVCYADKFFSKTRLNDCKTMEQARGSLRKFGGATMERFEEMVRLFGEP